MQKNLSEALNEAKERRGVFSKTIIWESGVSKSQFYRIIGGQEAPSAESKKRISDSLGIDIEQFDALFARSKLEPEVPNETPLLKRNKGPIAFGIGMLLVGAIIVAVNIVRAESDSPLKTSVVVENDRTLFIKDVTIPDGTSIPVNTTYVKTWRVKNIGNVAWENRYLKRMTPLSSLICSSPAMVPIPDTQPGETIDISVTFKTPHLPGSCRTDWKTSDDRGNLYFPDMHGLFSIVNVVEE
ncbi:MAG: NBR1-Ig-like domain-containing protein [Litorimonas sp.]